MTPEQNKPIRIAMIGAGKIAQAIHIPALQRVPGCQIVAIADHRPALAAGVAQRHQIESATGSYEAALQHADIDGIFISVFRWSASPLIEAALRQRKPVFCEKPLAQTVDGMRHLADLAVQMNVPLMAGFMKRYDAGIQAAKQAIDRLVQENTLGPIRFVRMYCFSRDYEAEFPAVLRTDEHRDPQQRIGPSAPSWIPEAERSAFDGFVNRSLHQVNLLRFLFGDALAVKGTQLSFPGAGVVNFETEHFPVVLEVGTTKLVSWNEGFEVHFEKGRIAVRVPSPLDRSGMSQVTIENGERREVVNHPAPIGWCFDRQAAAFVQLLRGDAGANLTPGADCVSDLELTERIWRTELESRSRR
jgi:predicted dehydrogenase